LPPRYNSDMRNSNTSEIRGGDKVEHKNSKQSFGTGCVRSVNSAAQTALVRWDRHVVSRRTPHLDTRETHVNLASLRRI
jgi:hypothetical protein